MQPQYVALLSSTNRRFEALESQPVSDALIAYLFHSLSTKFSTDCTQAIRTSIKGLAGRFALRLPVTRDRRNRCQRASRASSLSALPPLWPHVRVQKKKNLLSSIRNPFRSNQPILESISRAIIGQASGPVHPLLQSQRAPFQNGGAIC